ncbi:hypothetical protein SMC26_00625 [Actinomadura fulvescens]|uniref:Uncharacterized protein n=1 Tax=Actinomadura fulvescens TaxID=46160 RepID=A0ABP6C0X1_9ACTN
MAENETETSTGEPEEGGWLAWFRGAYEAFITVAVGLVFFVAFAYAKGML